MSDPLARVLDDRAASFTPDLVPPFDRLLARRTSARRRLAVLGTVTVVTAVVAGTVLTRPAAAPAPLATSASDSPLIVQDGDPVRAYGHVVVTDGRARLCGGPQTHDRFFGPEDPLACPAQPVPLPGFDASVLPAVPGGRAGEASVSGTWDGGSIRVRSQSTTVSREEALPLPSGGVFDDSVVPCAVPAGGWPAAFPQVDYPRALLPLRERDVLVTAVLRPAPHREVLGVVVPDAAAAEEVRAALRPDYGASTCVVVSEVSREQRQQALSGSLRDLGVDTVQGPEPVTGLHLSVSWHAVVVDRAVQDRLDALPDGLVQVSALVQPDRAAAPPEERLLAAADEAAARDGGEARQVQLVHTTLRRAERLYGSSSSTPDEGVWVVQVGGDDDTCGGCSAPYGAALPRGAFLTLVLSYRTLEVRSSGISPRGLRLETVGTVRQLR